MSTDHKAKKVEGFRLDWTIQCSLRPNLGIKAFVGLGPSIASLLGSYVDGIGRAASKREGCLGMFSPMEVMKGLIKWTILRVGFPSPLGETICSFLALKMVSGAPFFFFLFCYGRSRMIFKNKLLRKFVLMGNVFFGEEGEGKEYEERGKGLLASRSLNHIDFLSV